MKTGTKIILVGIAAVIVAVAMAMIAFIIKRERQRPYFSGCNLAHLNIAALDRGAAKTELEIAEADTNTPPEQVALLRQRLEEADARFQKWDAHVKEYGHLSGTATTATK